MKILYSTIFFLFFSILSISAQNVFYTLDGQEATEEAVEGAIINVSNYIKSVANKDFDLTWEKEVDKPDGWLVAICTNEVCSPDAIESGPFSIASGDSVDLKVQAQPLGNTGTATVTVRFFDPADPTNTNTMGETTFTVTATDPSTSLTNIIPSKKVFNTYPNPVRNTLNVELENYENITTLEVYNMVGRSVGTYSIENVSEVQQLDMLNLEEGMYFISLLDENGQLVETKRFSKIR